MLGRTFSNILVITLCLGLLNACAPPPPPKLTFQQSRQLWINQLRLQGAEVIQTGQTFSISLPGDKLFYPRSANFAPRSNTILEPLANLLANYQTGIMKISGHTDNSCNTAFNSALSEHQAQHVAKYLVAQGMDARLLYTVGYGASQPIAGNQTVAGQAQNRRIDIQFRFITPFE